MRKPKQIGGGGVRSRLVAVVAALAMVFASVVTGTALAVDSVSDSSDAETSVTSVEQSESADGETDDTETGTSEVTATEDIESDDVSDDGGDSSSATTYAVNCNASDVDDLEDCRFDHIDVKTAAAVTDGSTAGGTVTDVSTVRYTYTDQSGRTQIQTVSMRKNDNGVEWNSGVGLQNLTGSTTITITFTLGSETYTSTIDPSTTYPEDTYYPTSGDQYERLVTFLGNSAEYKYDDDGNELGVYISGMSVFLVSAIVCNQSTVSEGRLTVVDGLDLVLNVATLLKNSASFTFEVEKTLTGLDDGDSYEGGFGFMFKEASVTEGVWTVSEEEDADSRSLAIADDTSWTSNENSKTTDSVTVSYEDGVKGTSYYILYENKGTGGDVTYDGTVYGIKVEVTTETSNSGSSSTTTTQISDVAFYELSKSGNGYTTQDDSISIEKDDNGVYVFQFVNTYKSTPSPVTIGGDTAIEVTKKVVGADAEEDFKFSLTLTSDNADSVFTGPDGATPFGEGMTVTVGQNDINSKNDRTLTVSFDEITFTAAGTYRFTIDETSTTDATGWSYDESTYTVSVKVTQNDSGELVASISGNDPTFVNVYVESDSPDVSKYVDDNGDGTYDLSLDVTGTTVKQSTRLNVLYVLDESYSMMWDMDGSYPDDGSNTSGDDQYDSDGEAYDYSFERYQTALNAINSLNDTLESNSQLDVQYALVEFAATTRGTTGWTDDVEDLEFPDVEYGSFATGTNYGAAFYSAAGLLDRIPSDRSDAETIVIFLTDGDPNRSTIDGSGSTASAEDGIAFAKQYIDDLDCDSFYAIGMSDDVGLAYLQDLIGNVQEDVTAEAYQSSDASELVMYFAQLAARLAGTVTRDATIVDELSEYAQLVDPSVPPVISILDENGQEIPVTSPDDPLTSTDDGGYTGVYTFRDVTQTDDTGASEQTLTYTYWPAGTYVYGDESTNEYPVITLKFPKDYELTEDWTYTITVQIEPTSEAIEYDPTAEDASDRDGYPHVGDDDTDAVDNNTSSGRGGFYSNKEADLIYEDGNGGEHTVEYPHPVIQVSVSPVSSLPLTGGDTTALKLLLSGGVLGLLGVGVWLLAKRRRTLV